MNIEDTIEVKSAFINFCGVFSYQDNIRRLKNGFKDWYTEIDQLERDFYEKNYYDNYNSVIIKPPLAKSNISATNSFRHIVKNDNPGLKSIFAISKAERIEFSITRIDLFFFPENYYTDSKEKLGILNFRVEPVQGNMNIRSLNNLILALRRLEDGQVEYNNKLYRIIDFVNNFIAGEASAKISLKINFGTKLKSFLVINTNNYELSGQQANEMLFDLGNLLPIGTTHNESPNLSLTKDYYDEIIKKDLISVYRNWTALSLYDTFTVIGDHLDPITWGETYFSSYIHCLHLKFSLFRINMELSDDYKLKLSSQRIKYDFVNFLNNHNFYQISYNFLPNIIYEKICSGLHIQQEVEALERKVKEIDLFYDNIRNQRINSFLLVITIISFISAVWDMSEFIRSLVSKSETIFYPVWGLACLGFSFAILILLYLLYRFRKH